MKFLSDILAKAGLTVDGVVTLNNTATGQTPNANDNSTKLATTAWVRTFVQPYSLPIATASILGGIKVGEGLSINATTGVLSTVGGASITSFRSEYIITATAGQTTFTVPNGYTPGKIDLFLNGVYLNDNIYTATNSSTIVLDDAAALDDILTVFVYSTYYVGDSPSARTTTYFTATSNQTVFTVAYVIGQVDIFYNGSKLEPSEYTANNGTSITLLTPATTGDKIEVVNWAVGGGIASTRTITINGVTYDLSANRTWTLTTANISEVTNLYYTDARARAAISESVTGLDYNSATGVFSTTTGYGIPTTSSQTNWDAAYNDKINSAAVTGTTTKTLTLTQQDGGTITASWTDDNTDAVTSIFGRTGVVVAISGDYTTTLVTEGTNLYYTDVRSRTAISLTTTGTSGAATYDNTTGVINIPQYQGGVTSFNTRTGAITLSSSDVTTALTYTPVTNARTLTINGTTYDLTADRSWSIAAGVTSFNTRTGAISLTSLDVTDALTYTPVTNARTLTINGTSYDLSANRSWTIAPDVSVRNTYAFTATAAQTTFTVSGGYTVGLVDVFINGVKLAAADFTATNGTTVVLGTGTGVGNIVEIIKYVSAFTTAVETTRTLTINGTTYDLSANRTWSIDNASLGAQPQLNGTGLVRMSGTTVSYDNATYATQSYVTTAVANLVDSAPSTLDTLNELAAALGDDPNFATTIATSIGTKQAQLNGTGFVKISGTTISYDNSTYLTTASASSTYLPLAGGTLTGSLNGTSAGFSSSVTAVSGVYIQAANNSDLPFINFSNNGGVYNWGRIGGLLQGDGDGSLYFQTKLGGSLGTRLTISSTGAATFSSTLSATTGYFSGNVVIDNTSLNNPKFLQFDANINSGANAVLGDIRWYNKQWDASIKAQIVALTDTDITNGRLSFRTGTDGVNAIERLRISSTGASTFTSTVTAVTNLRVNSTGATGSAYSAVLINSPAVTWNIVNDDNGGDGDLRFYNDSLASDAIRIKRSNNNVGVNTPTPLEKFSVTGNAHIAGVGNGLYFDTDGSGRAVGQYVSNLYEFHIVNGRGNSAKFVLGNGSISLGTTSTTQFSINTSSGVVTFSNGQTGGYVRRDSGYVNETAVISENRTAYFLYKYSGDGNGSSSTTFNITGLSTANGTWADISLRVRKDATGSAINTVGYIQINGQDMIGAVFASGTGAVQTNRTIRVVRMSDEWIIIGAVGSY